MRTKKAKPLTDDQKAIKLESWYAGQNRAAFDDCNIYAEFEAGNGPILTIGDEHYEKHFNDDGDAYIMILWTDDNGIEAIG